MNLLYVIFILFFVDKIISLKKFLLKEINKNTYLVYKKKLGIACCNEEITVWFVLCVYYTFLYLTGIRHESCRSHA